MSILDLHGINSFSRPSAKMVLKEALLPMADTVDGNQKSGVQLNSPVEAEVV